MIVKLLKWPIHLSFSTCSFIFYHFIIYTNRNTHIHTNKRTHRHSHACTHTTHTNRSCKCHWEEMKAAVFLWFHLVCYIYLTLSGLYCPLSHTYTHWLFYHHFDMKVQQEHRGRSSEGTFSETNGEVFFSSFKQRNWFCLHFYLR